MPVDRDYLLADNPSYSMNDGSEDRLRAELKQTDEPQTKSFWVKKIKTHAKVGDRKAGQIFDRLVLDSFLLFLRVYSGKAIYVCSTTTVWFRDKMPVVVLGD